MLARNRVVVFGLLVGLGMLWALAATYGAGSSPAIGPAGGDAKALPQVSIVAPQARELALELSAQGHLVALQQVDVRAQVPGVIRAIHFREGDAISAGQLLFTLDNAEPGAQLARAQANAANVKAQLDDAVRAYDRSNELLKAKFLSQSAVDSALSKVDSLRAQLKASEAEIDNARVQVGYTRIVAPLSGRVGALNVHVGSLAQPSSTQPLVSLAQFDPIAVEFSLPEGNLPAVLAARAAGPVPVKLDLPGKIAEGTLSFVNNTVTTGTGTIALKATIPNPRQELWPGAFAQVRITAGASKGAMTLPPEALLEGPAGRFVYVLDGADQVRAKPVSMLRVQDRLAVVEGVAADDRVVLGGNHNIAAGTKVAAVVAPARLQ